MYIAFRKSEVLEKYMLPCLNKKLFGIDCFGCGMQRSAWLLLKGEFTAAFEMYPAIYPLLITVLFFLITLFAKIKYEWFFKVTFIVITASTMIISYIVKMNSIIN